MTNGLKHKITDSGECISEQTMFDYIDNKLMPKEQHRVEKHMLDCELCSDALDGLRLLKNRNILSHIGEEINERITNPSLRSTKPDLRIFLSIAAGLLLLIAGFFFFNQFTSPQKENIAELKNLPADESKIITKEKTMDEPVVDSEALRSLPVTTEKKEREVILSDRQDIPKKQEHKSPGAGAGKDNSVSTIPDESDKTFTLNENAAATEEMKNSSDGIAGNTTSGTSQSAGSAAPSAPASKNVKADDNNEDTRLSSAERAQEINSEGFAKQEALSKADKKNKSRKQENQKSGGRKEAESVSATESTIANGDLAQAVNKPAYSWNISDSILDEKEIVYTIVDEMPKFPGGENEMNKYIQKYLDSSISRSNNSDVNTLDVQFIVTSKGKAVHPKLMSPADKETEKKLFDFIKNMPVWEPGKLNGKPVAVFYTLPLHLNTK